MTDNPFGVAIQRPTPRATIRSIQLAEAGEIGTAWTTVGGTNPDAVTVFAVAASTSTRIGLGTSIVPAYTRHPAVLASQALVFADLAPDRFRLGVGPSHRPTIEDQMGVPMGSPLRYMREYVAVLRDLLWEGRADIDGEYFHVHMGLPKGAEPPKTPILLSALRPNAFRQAGEIADGAISWNCPIGYLVETALPSMHEGAEAAGRSVPPLIAHVPVALTSDTDAARGAGRTFLTNYARLPFYAGMFATAGYPVEDGAPSDALIDDVVVHGDGPAVAARLRDVLATGMSEVLVTLLPVGDPDDLLDDFAAAVR
jgi:alkanesulfonate monooxygenase SsuD/methylene tetrahydromethanopterin reductase-like flavin-dependent oxidoreductase (luciferase family)